MRLSFLFIYYILSYPDFLFEIQDLALRLEPKTDLESDF